MMIGCCINLPSVVIITAFVCVLVAQLFCEASTPGLRLRVSQSGVNYAASVAVDKMSPNVFSIPIPDESGVNYGLTRTEYNINGGRITHFQKPSSHVTVNPGSGVTWSLSGADIRVNGNWKYFSLVGWFIPVWDSGSYETNARGVWLSVTATLGWKSDGTPTLASTGCSCGLGSVSIRLSGGWGTWLYNFFMGGAEADLKRNVEPKLCEEARKAIDSNGVRQLATLQMRIRFLDRWMFDWSLVAAPRFMDGYIESDHRGELTLKGVNNSGLFQPTALRNPSSTPQMVTMWMSEYLMNHFGQVLFKSSILRYNQAAVNTTILGPLGFLLPPQLRNSPIEIDLTASEAPTLSIVGPHARGNFTGVAKIRSVLRNNSVADVLTIEVRVQLLVTPSFNGTHAKATNVSSLRAVGRVINSAIGPVQDLAVTVVCNYLMRTIVVPNLNVVGQRGFPIPHMNEDVTFVKAAFRLQDGLAVLATDVRYR